MMYKRVCGTCKKEFESYNEDAEICYGCALERITGGHAPEEGDFNTAAIVSGKWSPKEWREFQDDMNSIDHSREEKFQRRFQESFEDEWDSRWDYLEDDHDEEE